MQTCRRPTCFSPVHPPLLALVAFIAAAAIGGGCGKDKTTTPLDGFVVPDDFPTPQAAVDAAVAGQLVLVKPGTYLGSSVRVLAAGGDSVRASLFMKDGVSILGEGTAGQVVLRDTTGEPGVIGVVMDSVGYGAIVQNLVFDDYDTGALIVGRTGELIGNRFDRGRIGIHVRDAGQPYLIGNLVEDADSVGILNELSDGAFGANLVRGCDVGMATDDAGTAVYDSNVACRNRIGLWARRGSTPLLRGNAIRANAAFGVLLESGAIPDMKENDLYWNGEADLAVDDYHPIPAEPIAVWGNYWGPDVSVEEIGLSRILDAVDEASRGATVEYTPVSPAYFFDPSVDLNEACAARSAPELAGITRVMAGVAARLPFGTR